MTPIYPFIYKYVYISIQYLPIYLTVYISIYIYLHIVISIYLPNYLLIIISLTWNVKCIKKFFVIGIPPSPPPLRCSMVERLSRCNVLNDPLCGYYGFLLQLIYIKDTLCFQNMGKQKENTQESTKCRKVKNTGKYKM